MPRFDYFLKSRPERHGLQYCSCIAGEIVFRQPITVMDLQIDGTYEAHMRQVPAHDPFRTGELDMGIVIYILVNA